MSTQLIELAVRCLGELAKEVMFVGGATIPFCITDAGAAGARVTVDVDVVVEITTRPRFHAFEQGLREAGFSGDQETGVICRWRHPDGLILDAMPADPGILGFANRWQAAALPHAVRHRLPSGSEIRVISPPYLLATKLEAFADRGRDDFLGSRDFEDIVALFDGREELAAEVRDSPAELRAYVARELTRLLAHPRFDDGLFGALRGDGASQARARAVVRPRMDLLTD